MPETIGSGIESFAEDIAGAMRQYHKEHVAYDQQLGLAQVLSQMGINEQGVITSLTGPDGKPIKGVQQVVDPKAIDLFKTNAGTNRAKATGAMEAINRIAMTAAQHAIAKRLEDQDKVPVTFQGQTYKVPPTTALASAQATESAKARIPGQEALTAQRKTATQLNKIKVAERLGIIPKTVQPPTGGQIVSEQRSRRKEAAKERESIEKHFLDTYNLDPGSLLDPDAIEFGTMQTPKISGAFNPLSGLPAPLSAPAFTPNPDNSPKGATHVKVEGKLKPISTYKRLQEKAQRWAELGKSSKAPTLNIPPPAANDLLKNPTPEMKVKFDQIFGKGAADTVIGAQSNAAPPSDEEPEPEATEEEE